MLVKGARGAKWIYLNRTDSSDKRVFFIRTCQAVTGKTAKNHKAKMIRT